MKTKYENRYIITLCFFNNHTRLAILLDCLTLTSHIDYLTVHNL